MIAFMLLRTVLLIGILSVYSIGMFRLINQFFGERYQSHLRDELSKRAKDTLQQQKVSVSLSNNDFNRDDFCRRKIDGFYGIINEEENEVKLQNFCANDDDNDAKNNKLTLNDSSYNVKKHEHEKDFRNAAERRRNNENIKKKTQLKKSKVFMTTTASETQAERMSEKDEKHKFYDDADFVTAAPRTEDDKLIDSEEGCFKSVTEEEMCSVDKGSSKGWLF
ncbi:uncharacterized protein LOC134834630 isoform X1 [Culicoides brevitarsis]|uniref:uncharacterized protein LOC134834630 isoform X1 n=1 Tax=Culicoides brevitarsis TaxID=469753 RepID=UPI00307BF890